MYELLCGVWNRVLQKRKRGCETVRNVKMDKETGTRKVWNEESTGDG